jgi:CO/xanthine dehydrogenase FAD-binding subunit
VRYQRVSNEAELTAALSDPAAAILSGGTDLLVRIRGGLASPDLLIDVSGVPTLHRLRRTDSAIEIGAAVPENEILASPAVRNALPLLATALRTLGSIQIRNRGTLGGNLVNASPAADSAIPLLLYDAELDLVSSEGQRTVAVDGFFLRPGRAALRPGEFVRTVRIPIPEAEYQGFYHKVGKRRALTIAIASLGALIRVDKGLMAEARFAAGSVAPIPVRLRAVEDRLQGSPLTEDLIEEARCLAMDSISPISDIRATAEYRFEVIGDLVARALRDGLHD